MTADRVVARVVFPIDGDVDVLPLYVDGEHVPTVPHDGETQYHPVVPRTQRPDQVLGRRGYRIEPGQRASFATYFNAFPAAYWRRWTVVDEVTLRVRTNGPGTLLVYRSSPREAAARVASVTLTGDDEHAVTLPLAPFGDGGWYWFDLAAGRDELQLVEADWRVHPSDRPTGRVTVGVTTFNRPAYCSALLHQLGSRELDEVLTEVVVVDQGSRRIREDPDFAGAHAGLGSRLTVVEQANLGGSGGFSRAMLETVDRGRSEHLMLLDDDVVCEPEGIARAAAFADFASKPTIVGGHMFSMHQRSLLHAFGEVVLPWQFRWAAAEPTVHDHDLAQVNLRSTAWMHRRVDVDYNGWWMCLIPVSVVRSVGLSLPLFIKWDDAEYGLRAGAAGYPTVSLPGAAVWHLPWTEKDDHVDWQAYFHARNRLVVALLHSPFRFGGRMVRESLAINLKHLLGLQYSTVLLRQRAVEDVLAGPDALHEDLPHRLAEVRALRGSQPDADVRPDPEAFLPIRRGRPRRREQLMSKPVGGAAILAAAMSGVMRQLLPVSPGAAHHPQRQVPAVDAGWWSLSRLDSAVVSTTDGTGVSLHRRDRAKALAMLRDSVMLHQRLLAEWPTLARRYRDAAGELAGEDAWRKTLDLPGPETAA